MDIGIQRGYFKAHDGRQWIGSIPRYFAILLLSFLTMHTPAHAAIETANPTGGGYYTLIFNGPTYGQYSTAAEACADWFVTLGPGAYAYHYAPATDMDGGYCTAFVIGHQISSSGTARYIDATCPVPPVNPQNSYVFNRATRMCERTVANKCPIDELPDFPLPTDDSCTKSLEKGAGKDVDNVCPPLDDRWTKPNGGQLQCLADKISKLGLSVPYKEPSATIRTVAYQEHFVKLWKWKKDFNKLTDLEKQACVSDVSKVDAELAMHGIDAPPSKKEGDAPHVLGKAIDISRGVKNALIKKVSNSYYITPIPPFCYFCPIVPVHIGDVQDYVNSSLINPPACHLRWGGRFDPYDPVHFQLP